VVIDASRFFPVVTITGPRQSGKTTLIRNLFDKLPYYSLENPDVLSFALNDPVGFLKQHQNGMILDEVQNAPTLFSYIQGFVDEDPNLKFVLSGSTQFAMLKTISQSLAGRTALFELLPLSYAEMKDLARNSSKGIDDHIFEGFYPVIHAEENLPEYLYPNYVRTYLERDVRDLIHIKDLMQFQTFLRLCAARIGSLFNASELANEVGVAANTIKAWLSVLQASYIIKLLPPYFENVTKRLIKTPKLYFTDTGLACYLLGIKSAQQLSRDKMRGLLFENLVVIEALKARFNNGKESNLYFYRDSHQNEVDLLLKQRNHFSAIEIKSAQTYHAEFGKGLKVLGTVLGDRLTDRAIVYTGEFENFIGNIKLLNYKHMNSILLS
jgi:predicted AAA+ superfamily ATPase